MPAGLSGRGDRERDERVHRVDLRLRQAVREHDEQSRDDLAPCAIPAVADDAAPGIREPGRNGEREQCERATSDEGDELDGRGGCENRAGTDHGGVRIRRAEAGGRCAGVWDGGTGWVWGRDLPLSEGRDGIEHAAWGCYSVYRPKDSRALAQE